MKKPIIEEVVSIINTYLKDIDITINNIDDNLRILGMDSISFIQVIVSLEETYECQFPDSKLIFSDMDTVRKIWNVLQSVYSHMIIGE